MEPPNRTTSSRTSLLDVPYQCCVGFLLVFQLFLLSACSSGGGDPEPADSTPPEIQSLEPAVGTEIADITRSLTFRITDLGGSGVDASGIAVVANGVVWSGESVFSSDVLTITPTASSRWQRGPLEIRIQAKDKAGNRADGVFSYTVSPATQALPRAIPEHGDAPLTVSFHPDVSIDAVIESYEWDFDNDGVYDVSEPIGREQKHRFDQPGNYVVKLKVTDNFGVESVGEVTVVVGNAVPRVQAEALPSNGEIPLTVHFTVHATDNEGIASYAWDFDGDGTAEKTDSTGNNQQSVTHVYREAGLFRPVVTVTDVQGVAARLQVPSIEVLAGPAGSPSVTANAMPAEGKAPLRVSLDANVTDPNGHSVSRWEWDFDGDGDYDHSDTSTARITHEYSVPGDYYARVRVIMSDGGTAEDVVHVRVLQEFSLSLSTDTLNNTQGETVTVQTTLAGESTVSLVIENQAGTVVRRLVDELLRAGGRYEDTWDGKDDQGRLVPGGQYRVILLYEEDGETKRFDLGLTTGGKESNPTATYDRSFAPFAGDPLEIDYSISRASEVTAFMGYLGAGTRRLFTFFHRRPHGRGSHRILWNGENDDGVMIEPPQDSSGFLVGLFAYTLPDNAIIVNNRVELSGIRVKPPVLTPEAAAEENRIAIVEFELNRDARVTHTVNNAETGEIVYSKVYENMTSGTGLVTWDGKNTGGVYSAPGYYRHGITAVDTNGNKSFTLYTMQRLYY